jgi:hypothetical protein
MDKPLEHYWKLRLAELKKRVGSQQFRGSHRGLRCRGQKNRIGDTDTRNQSQVVSWGGSMTFTATGLYDALKSDNGFEVLDVFDRSLSPEENIELRRRSLLVDLYLTGTNAVTETGKLVNLDMTGNRVAAITFGPRNVIVLVGRNKIVPDDEEASYRIKDYAAPANAMRLDKKTPCVKTSYCEDCKSPDRVCNTWTITEKSFPKGRIKIVLINDTLGL